jgi:hypothetical protein
VNDVQNASRLPDCRTCGTPLVSKDAWSCAECHAAVWRHPGPARLAFHASRVSKAVSSLAIPILAFVFGWWTQYQETERARQQTRRETLAELKKQVGDVMDLSAKVFLARSAVESACSLWRAEPESPQAPCGGALLEATTTLDDLVGALAWKVDTLPVDSKAAQLVTDFNKLYWRGCEGNTCGYRASIVKALHSGLEGTSLAFRECKHAEPDARVRVACNRANEQFKTDVMRPLGSEVSLAFCAIMHDLNRHQIEDYRLLGEELGDGRLAALANTLEDNTKRSSCAEKLKKHQESLRPREAISSGRLRPE